MRIAAALFVALHGIGYSIWFLSAWVPSVLGTGSKQLTFGDVPATGGLGKALGVVALLVLAGFLASAWGIWQETSWWPVSLIASAIVGIPIAFSVWNPVGTVSVMAELANAGLVAATLVPWGDRLLGAH